MIQALVEAQMQDERVDARKSELASMSMPQLKELLVNLCLEVNGKKEELVQAVLNHEAQCLQKQHAFEAKVQEALSTKKTTLWELSASKLQEMCTAGKLSTFGAKEALIGRLTDQAVQDGEIDRMAAKLIRAARKEELSKFEKAVLVDMCDKAGIDSSVKEIMVERLLAQDDEVKE